MERKYNWYVIAGISIFISLFLLVFQPFGLHNLQSINKELFLMGYGGITFLVLVIFLILLPQLVKQFFHEYSWKVWKHIIFFSLIILFIGSGNFIYTIYFIDHFSWSWKSFLLFQFFTFVIGIIPVTVTTLIELNQKLKMNLDLAKNLNMDIHNKKQEKLQKEHTVELTGKNKNENIRLEPNEIAFIQSEGNYVQIFYRKNDELKHQMLRNTLSNIRNQLNKYNNIIPCHRAYMVNTEMIEEANGNAQGFTLKLKQTDIKIPVSRKYVSLLKENLSN